jgi:TPR repeat protein
MPRIIASICSGSAVRRLAAALIFLGFALFGSTANAEKRVALVIGEASYVHAGALANPLHDADIVTQALKSVGFQVDERKDLSADGLRRALLSFTALAESADIAVIYFAGHGMQLDGHNYLVPVDAEIRSPMTIGLETVSAEDLVTSVAGARRLRLVILDACRDNPFKDRIRLALENAHRSMQRGLAPISVEGTSDTLVAYAAKDGMIADDGPGANSPYALALVRHISEAGTELDKMLREVHDDVFSQTKRAQEPSVYGARSAADFFFVPPLPTAAMAQPAGADAEHRVTEAQLWPQIVQQDTASGYDIYMTLFPHGLHHDEATARQRALTASPPAPPDSASAFEKARAVVASVTDNDWARGGYDATAAKVMAQISIDDLRKLADNGDAPAQLIAWSLYNGGVGVPKNGAEALRYLRASADNGNVNAEFILGYRIENGLDGRSDPGLASTWYQKAVEKNYGPAEINLGNMYLRGSGVPKDSRKALDLYKMAAALGVPLAYANIGFIYDAGEGVAKDPAEALRWFHQVESIDIAQTAIGLHLLEGNGVAKDPSAAVTWLRKAAAQNDTVAKFDLGAIYSGSYDIPEDRAETRKWMKEAAADGDKPGLKSAEISKSVDDAKRWLRDNPDD